MEKINEYLVDLDMLGVKLKKTRKKLKLYIRNVSEITGIKQGRISMLEAGGNDTATICIEEIARLAKCYNTTIDQLINTKGMKPYKVGRKKFNTEEEAMQEAREMIKKGQEAIGYRGNREIFDWKP